MTWGTTLVGGRFKVKVDERGRRTLHYRCPACDILHGIKIDGPNAYLWDQNGRAPTVTPSVLIRDIEGVGTCHHSITEGMLTFHHDSDHDLAERTVPMLWWHNEE